MTTITTRSGKGSPLTNDEVDANFTGLNTDKVETSGDSMTGDLSFGDNNKVILGSGNDLKLYHDGSDSYVDDTGTGRLRLRGAADIILAHPTNGETYATFSANGANTFYYDNTARLATSSTGIDVTGNATFGDSGKAIFGAGSDLQIYHDGVHSYIEDAGTGALKFITNGSDDRDVAIQSDEGSGGNLANYLLADGSTGAVTAYHYGSTPPN